MPIILQEAQNYVSVKYAMEGRVRLPNMAVYTQHNNDMWLGVRNSVTIDIKRHPQDALDADKLLIELKKIITNNEAAFKKTDPEEWFKDLFGVGHDDFVANYNWYIYNKIDGLDLETCFRQWINELNA